MRLSLIAIGTAVALIGGFASAQDPQLLALEHLKEPKISTKKNEKMLVVEAKGDPTTVGAKAFKRLKGWFWVVVLPAPSWAVLESPLNPPSGAEIARRKSS